MAKIWVPLKRAYFHDFDPKMALLGPGPLLRVLAKRVQNPYSSQLDLAKSRNPLKTPFKYLGLARGSGPQKRCFWHFLSKFVKKQHCLLRFAEMLFLIYTTVGSVLPWHPIPLPDGKTYPRAPCPKVHTYRNDPKSMSSVSCRVIGRTSNKSKRGTSK